MQLLMKQKLTLFFSLAILAISCKTETEVQPGTTALKVELPDTFSDLPVPADNPMTVEGVALGRMLFYEKRLSSNNTISCGSCHQQKFAFADNNPVSLGADGMPGTRSTMSLANVAWFKNLMWDGRDATLENQAKGPIQNPVEMHQSLVTAVNKLQNTQTYPPLFQQVFGSKTITEENLLKAIAQFERTLISADSKYDQYMLGQAQFNQDEEDGRRLFLTHPNADPAQGRVVRGGNCGDCHGGSLLARQLIVNNGLDADPADKGLGGVNENSFDNGKFKVVTLRNIALTAPYMHDGRFKSLEEVLDHYNEHVKKNSPNLAPDMTSSNIPGTNQQLGLTADEKRKIVAFLKTLTDEKFVTDARFSDPFAETGMVK
jgi:cytochrome c peroxidase